MLATSELSSLAEAKKPKLSAILPGNLINYDSKQLVPLPAKKKKQPEYPAVCTELITMDAWLGKYGLARNKLTFQDVLSMCGFRKVQDYETLFDKTIASKYAKGVFLQTTNEQGKIYNVNIIIYYFVADLIVNLAL
jgi:hypothetical protein